MVTRSRKAEGIVIRRRNSGEADRILTLFTNERGKISVKAPNVRKITSRRSPHTELLNHGIFFLHEGRGLPLVTEVQTRENFQKLKNNLERVGFAYHVCELIDGLCAENQENEKIFELLLNTLRNLSIADAPGSLIHSFEIHLLTYLGFYKELKFQNPEQLHAFIEHLLERKLRAKNIFRHFR